MKFLLLSLLSTISLSALAQSVTADGMISVTTKWDKNKRTFYTEDSNSKAKLRFNKYVGEEKYLDGGWKTRKAKFIRGTLAIEGHAPCLTTKSISFIGIERNNGNYELVRNEKDLLERTAYDHRGATLGELIDFGDEIQVDFSNNDLSNKNYMQISEPNYTNAVHQGCKTTFPKTTTIIMKVTK